MTRGVRWYLVGSVVLVALIAVAGCSHYLLAEREPWRHEAEVACLNSGAREEIAGAGAHLGDRAGRAPAASIIRCKVSALGESGPLGYDRRAAGAARLDPRRDRAAAMAGAVQSSVRCRPCRSRARRTMRSRNTGHPSDAARSPTIRRNTVRRHPRRRDTAPQHTAQPQYGPPRPGAPLSLSPPGLAPTATSSDLDSPGAPQPDYGAPNAPVDIRRFALAAADAAPPGASAPLGPPMTDPAARLDGGDRRAGRSRSRRRRSPARSSRRSTNGSATRCSRRRCKWFRQPVVEIKQISRLFLPRHERQSQRAHFRARLRQRARHRRIRSRRRPQDQRAIRLARHAGGAGLSARRAGRRVPANSPRCWRRAPTSITTITSTSI